MAIDTTGISYINYLWTKKNADGTLTGIRLDKLNLPTDVAYLSDIPTDYVTLGTAQTITGFKTFSAPSYISGVEQTTMKIKTSNGGSITFGKQDKNSGSMIRLDQTDGTCRLRLRGSQVDGTLIWEQPETDSALYMDVEKIHFRGVDAFYLNKTIAADYLYTSSTGLVTKGTFKTLTIQKNGTNVATFKGNSNNTTANITIATTDVNNSSSNVDGDTVNDVFDGAKAIRSSDGSINISLTNGYVDFKVASAPISINLNGSGQLVSGTARGISAGNAINLDIVDGNLQISSDTLSVTSSGSGNAVTGISVDGHTIKLTKGSTFLTSSSKIVTTGTASSGYFFNLHGEFDNHTIILFPTGSSNSFSVSFDSSGSSPITVYGFLVCSHYSTPGLVRYFNSSGVLKSSSPDALTVKSQVVYIKF